MCKCSLTWKILIWEILMVKRYPKYCFILSLFFITYNFSSKGKTVKSMLSSGEAIAAHMTKTHASAPRMGSSCQASGGSSELNSSSKKPWRTQCKSEIWENLITQMFLLSFCDPLNFTFVMKSLQGKLRVQLSLEGLFTLLKRTVFSWIHLHTILIGEVTYCPWAW